MAPFHVIMFSAKSFLEDCLRYVPSVARFLKVAFQGLLLWTLLYSVRLQYVAMTRFAHFLISPIFSRLPFVCVAPHY